MALMTINVPEDLNKTLRMFALKENHGSREKATIFILWNFLGKIFEIEKNEEDEL